MCVILTRQKVCKCTSFGLSMMIWSRVVCQRDWRAVSRKDLWKNKRTVGRVQRYSIYITVWWHNDMLCAVYYKSSLLHQHICSQFEAFFCYLCTSSSLLQIQKSIFLCPTSPHLLCVKKKKISLFFFLRHDTRKAQLEHIPPCSKDLMAYQC